MAASPPNTPRSGCEDLKTRGEIVQTDILVIRSLPLESKLFVTERVLASEMELATELANNYFPHASSISFAPESDPEVADSWIEIRVATLGATTDLPRDSKKFSAEWVSRTVPNKRHLIRQSLDAV